MWDRNMTETNQITPPSRKLPHRTEERARKLGRDLMQQKLSAALRALKSLTAPEQDHTPK
jgi:hypothetical protein